jgi:Kelch motif
MRRFIRNCNLFLAIILGLAICLSLDSQASEGSNKRANPRFGALKANTVMDLGRFNWKRPAGEPRIGRVTDYSGMTYDMHNHRILLFGGGHSTTWTDTIYVFDFKTLKWSCLYEPTAHKFYKKDNMDRSWWKAGPSGPYPRPVGRHTYDLLIVPDDRPEFHMLRTGTGPSSAARGFGYIGGGGGVFNFKTGKWKLLSNNFGGYGAVAEYHPGAKMIIGQSKQDITAMDPATGKCTKIRRDIQDKQKVSGYSGSMIYFPPDGKLYVIPSKMYVWTLALDLKNLKQSKIEKLKTTGQPGKARESSFVYDSKNKLLGGGVSNNKFYVFDPVKKEWQNKTVTGGAPGTLTFHNIIYNPVDNVYIFIAKDKTWAYRWK